MPPGLRHRGPISAPRLDGSDLHVELPVVVESPMVCFRDH
jgi:hypothetical protein